MPNVTIVKGVPLTYAEHVALGHELKQVRDALHDLYVDLGAHYPRSGHMKLLRAASKAVDQVSELRNQLDNQLFKDCPGSEWRGVYYGPLTGAPWFAISEFPDEPPPTLDRRRRRFPYSRSKHSRLRADLIRLMDRLSAVDRAVARRYGRRKPVRAFGDLCLALQTLRLRLDDQVYADHPDTYQSGERYVAHGPVAPGEALP